jgi:hypothetical protein
MEAPFDAAKSKTDLLNFSGSASDMMAAMEVTSHRFTTEQQIIVEKGFDAYSQLTSDLLLWCSCSHALGRRHRVARVQGRGAQGCGGPSFGAQIGRGFVR